MDHSHLIEDLAAALQASDLARIQTFPPALLLRRDACVPYPNQNIVAAPMAWAIDYALYAIVDRSHRQLPPWPTALLRGAPEALATELVAETPEFAVVDWLLDRFPQQLLDAPLDHHPEHSTVPVTTKTPLRRTLESIMRPTPYEALALLARLLQRGAALDIEAFDGQRSPLCYALQNAFYPAGTHAVRMLLAAGARLAPGEAPMAVRRCLTTHFNPRYMTNAPAAQLRTLLPVYGLAERGSGLFETIEAQESVATTWLHNTDTSLEVLDALRLLGLRMDVVRRVRASDAINEADRRRATIALRRADHASGERAMRTLAVRALGFAPAGDDAFAVVGDSSNAGQKEGATAASSSSWRRARLPLDIVSDIARRASADAPSWQLALGPMDPPLSLLRGGSAAAAAIAAADARASQRRAEGAP